MDTNTRNKAKSTGLGPKRIAVAIVLGLLMFTACTSIDCPMNNSVMLKMVFKGDVTTLTDTLTITAIRTGAEDTIVYYKGVNILTEVSTTNNRLEQVTINNSKVNTDATQEHLYLYLRP